MHNTLYKILHLFFLPDLAAGRGLRTALTPGKLALCHSSRAVYRAGNTGAYVPDGFVKHALQVTLRQCRALEVLMCADLLGHGQGLLVRDGLHLSGSQGLGGVAVVSQVELGAHEDDGDVGGVVFDLRIPLVAEVSRMKRQRDKSCEGQSSCVWVWVWVRVYLGFDVIEGWRADNRETDQEDVGLRVGERSEAIVVFLSGGIPQSQANRSAIDHHAGRVIVKAAMVEVVSHAANWCRGKGGPGRPTRSGCTLPGRHSLCRRSKDMSRAVQRFPVNTSLPLFVAARSEGRFQY